METCMYTPTVVISTQDIYKYAGTIKIIIYNDDIENIKT